MTKRISQTARALAIGMVAALVLAGTAGAEVIFQDDFESGLSLWTKRSIDGGVGDISISANQAHSGKTSLHVSLTSGGGNYVDYTFPSEMQGKLTIWFYDTMDSSISNIIISAFDNNFKANGVTGIYPYTKFYRLKAGFDPSDISESTVSRSKGWHKVVFDINNEGTKVFLDNIEQPKAFSSYNKLRMIRMGIGWGTTGEIYYDDISFTSTSGITSEASRNGLVGEYHFDGDAKDSSGNGNDGTIKGATFVQGVRGQALSFDGVNAGVNFGDPASGALDFGATDSFTVELFGKFDGFSSPRWLIQKGGPNLGLPGYGIAHDTNILEFTIGDPIGSGPNTPVSSLSTGKWYHIAGVRDVVEDKIKMYVDGVLVNVVTDTTTGTLATTSSFFIGRRSDGYYFDGSIDEVRMYNRALSAEEIKANYDSIIGKSPATTATKPASAPTSSPATPAPTITQTTIPTPAPTAAPEASNSYVYAGIGGLVLLLVAIVALKRRSSSKVEEPLKREPAVKPEPQKPTPLTDSPKIKPAPMTVHEAPGVYVKTAFGYKGAAIIYKLKIENNTSDPISDIKVYPYIPDVFLLKEKEKSIALIEPKASQTVTFEIRPTGECGDCNVSGRMNYYDMASRKRQDIELEQKSLSIVCPMLHGKEISEAEWHDTVSNLVKTEESTREIDMPAESLFTMISRVIKDMHMYMQKPEVTQNHKLFNGVARFYGEGVKGLKYAAQVEVVGGAKKSKLILKVWAEKEDALTGFYHGMLDEIEKRVNVKEYIDDSIVQYNVHIGDKIGTLVKDSVVQRSTIGASVRKCPNCGREVEANEKFCLECGAKLNQ